VGAIKNTPHAHKQRGAVAMIKYDRLFALLEQRGHSLTYWLRQNGFHSATVTKLRKNERINSDTINSLCRLLHVQPGDILEYAEDEKDKAIRAAIDAFTVQPTREEVENEKAENIS